MSDSDSDCEMVSSQPDPPKVFDTVPESREYQFKFIQDSTQMKLKYVLKEGKPLPYQNTLTSRKGKVFLLTFSKSLTPTVDGYTGTLQEDWHVFTKDVENSTQSISEDVAPEDNASSPSRSADDSQNPDIEQNEIESRGSEENDEMSTEGRTSSAPMVISVHQNPNWLAQLRENFNAEIISRCSSRVKEAINKNEYIECDKEFKRVKNEILYSVVCRLQKIFGRGSRPGKGHMREIVVQLVLEYPEMFRSREETSNKRGVDKLDVQAQKLCDRYREKLRRETAPTQSSQTEDDDAPPVKKAKMREVYGVSKEKWHKKKKLSIQTLAVLNRLQEERDFNKREAVFEEHRDELCHEFRESRANINRICKPFFMDSRHLGLHFQFMTETPALDEKVEENFKKFIGYLEVFILDADRSIETRKSLEDVELVCAIEYSGSTIFKDIHLLRLVSEHFDGTTSLPLVRLESDAFENDNSGSPHLLAVVVEKNIIFEVWVENSKLLGNLSLVQGLTAFFHLCFCFDLKYPKGGQTVADLLQRQVCKYGDDSGTRTWKRKDAAEKKVEYFRAQICKLIL